MDHAAKLRAQADAASAQDAAYELEPGTFADAGATGSTYQQNRYYKNNPGALGNQPIINNYYGNNWGMGNAWGSPWGWGNGWGSPWGWNNPWRNPWNDPFFCPWGPNWGWGSGFSVGIGVGFGWGSYWGRPWRFGGWNNPWVGGFNYYDPWLYGGFGGVYRPWRGYGPNFYAEPRTAYRGNNFRYTEGVNSGNRVYYGPRGASRSANTAPRVGRNGVQRGSATAQPGATDHRLNGSGNRPVSPRTRVTRNGTRPNTTARPNNSRGRNSRSVQPGRSTRSATPNRGTRSVQPRSTSPSRSYSPGRTSPSRSVSPSRSSPSRSYSPSRTSPSRSAPSRSPSPSRSSPSRRGRG